MGLKQKIQKIDFINHAYTKYKWRERKVSYGKENREKQFYIVRRATAKVGLFSLVLTNLGYIKYALEQGYIPVVDMQNYTSFYQGISTKSDNMWEYFFKQPCGYTLEDIKKSEKVIKGNGIIRKDIQYPDDSIAYDVQELEIWKTIADKYLIVNDNIEKEANEIAQKLFGTFNVLGVLARGTDYVNMRPYNHPIQPTVEQLMEKIDVVMVEQNCTKIYLATEDKGIFIRFKDKYGDKVIALDVERHETRGNENINDIRRTQKKDGYTIAKEYLLTILLLSKCDCLVAGNTSGSIGALLLNKKYKYQYIFNLGRYGNRELTDEKD